MELMSILQDLRYAVRYLQAGSFARRVPVEIEETGEYRAIQACAPAPRVTLSPRRGERP
jgi:hypothetical protein